MIDALYNELDKKVSIYLPTPARERIYQAFLFACEAHGDQIRKSGELFVSHPIIVATYLAQMYLDEKVIIGALLHDVAEDTERTLDDIEAAFGSQIRHLVYGVTHLANVSQLEDLANLILAMSSDIRVVLIKLYDRLHNLRTLHYLPLERRRRKALETQRIYVPIAAKLGMWHLKTEFETLILSHIDPDLYQLICDGIDRRFQYHQPILDKISSDIQQILRAKRIPSNIRIQRRSPYRIYENMTGDKLADDAYSKAFQLVISVDSLPECYLVLAHIHDAYPHVTGSLRDSIGNPKDIFYRSLHTDLIVPDYPHPVHLRIRTYEFDRLSELGILAEIQFATPEQERQPEHAPWLPKLPELYSEVEDANRFVESVFQDILQKQMVCFTPRGKEVSLPRHATVLDFAYHVHTDIGHECRAALVNGKQVDLSYQLRDGDQVYIIRSRQAMPRHDWMDEYLGYVVTQRARRKIRDWFRRLPAKRLIRLGRETLRDERRRFNVPQIATKRLIQHFALEDAEQLYLSIGNGGISITELDAALIEQAPNIIQRADRAYVEVRDSQGQIGWLSKIGTQEIKLANCCQPQVGDDILALINESRKTAMIHREDCRHIMQSKRTERLVRTDWLSSIDPIYRVYIRIEGYDRGGLLRDIAIPIAEHGGNITQADSAIRDKLITIRLSLELDSPQNFILIMHRLANLQNIRYVQRMSDHDIQHWTHPSTELAGD